MTAPLSTASATAAATATPKNQKTFTLADLTPGSTDPNLSINTQNQTGRLQFPEDLPPYYLQIDLAQYNRSTWDKAGTIATQISIVLPFPQMMIDAQQIEWDTVPLGMVGAGALNVARGAFGQGSVGAFAKDLAGQVAGGAAAGVLQGGGTIGQGVLAAGGVAVNQFLTMMLKGPSYREIDFSWTFSPRSATETQRLVSIIALINDAAAPSLLGATSAFFGYPYIFNCSFHFNNATLGSVANGPSMIFNFKPAVVRNRVWNYTGAGQPAHFGTTRGPAVVNFNLKLVELEFWLAGQYGSGLNPSQGTALTQSIVNGTKNYIDSIINAGNQVASGGGTNNQTNPATNPASSFPGIN